MANFAFEHYEIAVYKSLLTLADAVGHAPAKAALTTSLKEEEAMAPWIDQSHRRHTLRFVERSAAGAQGEGPLDGVANWRPASRLDG